VDHKIIQTNIINNYANISCKQNLVLLTLTLQVGTLNIALFNPRKHSIIIYNTFIMHIVYYRAHVVIGTILFRFT